MCGPWPRDRPIGEALWGQAGLNEVDEVVLSGPSGSGSEIAQSAAIIGAQL